jgi:RNA polymerase sigma-70 factor (ECF subfamily)
LYVFFAKIPCILAVIRLPMATMITDPLLLQQAAAGNKEAYNMLFATHYYRLYDFMLRTERMSQIVVEDICQNIFLRLWAKKEVFLTIDCFETYLRTAGHNAACDCQKKEKFRQRLNNNYKAYCEAVEQHTGDRVIYKEGRILADKVIAALQPREKLIFTRYN